MNPFLSVWRTLCMLFISSLLIFAALTAIIFFLLAVVTAANM